MTSIATVRTIRIAERPNLLWVEIETEDGLVGLGETFRGAGAAEAAIHELFATLLLGKDPNRVECYSRLFSNQVVGFNCSGAEMRGASALDIALWDLKGKRLGAPVHELLGGLMREDIPVYNTCAGYAYNSQGPSRRSVTGGESATGPYDDQIAFMKDAGELARSLVDEGFSAMKIWPFDAYAGTPAGNRIRPADLREGLRPFAKVRDAVGDAIDVMCELHSLWTLGAATTICRALEDYGVFWAEDPLCKNDDAKALADLRSRTSTPLCVSETLGGVIPYRDLLAAGGVDYVMVDLAWCGGLTVGKKIAALAEAHCKPVTPHDCTGPVVLLAGVHFALSSPTAVFQEVVRAYLSTWYREIVTELPTIADGCVLPMTAPGLGAALRPEIKMRADATIRESKATA